MDELAWLDSTNVFPQAQNWTVQTAISAKTAVYYYSGVHVAVLGFVFLLWSVPNIPTIFGLNQK